MLFNTFGENYYFDLDKLEKEIELVKSSEETTGETQFHLVKYEMIKMMMEVILTESESIDEKLGPNREKIIKEVEAAGLAAKPTHQLKGLLA